MTERKGTKALEIWCRRLVKDCPNPNVQIENMTTSWRNGLAFCALIHHFRPDLIDVSTLKPENVYENNKLAFSLAEKYLGIPSLLDPEDMVANEVPDRLSILTYLSQFYQRLSHTVQRGSETDSNPSSPSTTKTTSMKFGKINLDKCAVCNLPVYLAQRLIVSQKLYHRRCFRCSKCSGLLNPKNFEGAEFCDFLCESCKNEKMLPSVFNMDQMGMLAFDDQSETTDETDIKQSELAEIKRSSVLDKICMFEKKLDPCTDKLSELSITDGSTSTSQDLGTRGDETGEKSKEIDHNDFQETKYKSDINKFNFLKTQLQEDDSTCTTKIELGQSELKLETQDTEYDKKEINRSDSDVNESSTNSKNESNVTDDSRLAKSLINTFTNLGDITTKKLESSSKPSYEHKMSITNNDNGPNINVPPRKKKSLTKKTSDEILKSEKTENKTESSTIVNYPDHLNPFSDDEEENEDLIGPKPKLSTNPFGSSSDEEDDVVATPTPEKSKTSNGPTPTPIKRLVSANPFWLDDEEPSSEEGNQVDCTTNIYKSQITTSTPNLPSGTPHRKKGKAPPPPVITVNSRLSDAATSMDDVASISSYSSYNSTAHSDQKSVSRITPRARKKHLAPQPDSISTKSGGGSTEHGVNSIGRRTSTPDGGGRPTKGPAPGLPLPERRAVKLQMSPAELQLQLDLLETQQLGLERQGVLIEQMIRDKCEGDAASTVPQEEVEDLVIQLCELVNEKNDLFRKQTELMYIRRQQRLEQEQADIEHEIRIIQSRPAVNRIDADKAREEQLVSRLVQIVRLRDELVQQMEAERRRERQEDHAIAASIASKRAQRNSGAKSSSLKSDEIAATAKKSKVKDKMKKQFKKAKHSFIPKKI